MKHKLLFMNKYRIASTRLIGWDYSSAGIYFLTINTKYSKYYFGEIKNKKMILNQIGKLVEKYWKEIPNRFSNAKLDEFIIMPNHIHGIIILSSISNGHPVSGNTICQDSAHLLSSKSICRDHAYPLSSKTTCKDRVYPVFTTEPTRLFQMAYTLL